MTEADLAAVESVRGILQWMGAACVASIFYVIGRMHERRIHRRYICTKVERDLVRGAENLAKRERSAGKFPDRSSSQGG